jgi:hypothetical protein
VLRAGASDISSGSAGKGFPNRLRWAGVVTDLNAMKLLTKKKTNPAFKRLQVIPPLPDLPVCRDRVKDYAVAPAVVILAPRPEARPETSPLCA